MKATLTLADHAKELEEKGKLERHHVVGKHGERLLARSLVYNFARYEIYPLTEARRDQT